MSDTNLKLVDEIEFQVPEHTPDREMINLCTDQRGVNGDRREATREGDKDRRAGNGHQNNYAASEMQTVKKTSRPVINRREQLARLHSMQDCYYGVRVTRARCKPAIELLDVVFSFAQAPSLPLPECTETCTCQYQGVRDRRCGPRRVGPPDRRKAVREGEPVRRVCQGRRKSDYGFVFFRSDE